VAPVAEPVVPGTPVRPRVVCGPYECDSTQVCVKCAGCKDEMIYNCVNYYTGVRACPVPLCAIPTSAPVTSPPVKPCGREDYNINCDNTRCNCLYGGSAIFNREHCNCTCNCKGDACTWDADCDVCNANGCHYRYSTTDGRVMGVCKRLSTVPSATQCAPQKPAPLPPQHKLHTCFDVRTFEANVNVLIGKLGLNCEIQTNGLGNDGKSPTHSYVYVTFHCASLPPSFEDVIKGSIGVVVKQCYNSDATTNSRPVTTAVVKRSEFQQVQSFQLSVDNSNGGGGLSAGAIAGIVVGAVCGVLLLIAIVVGIYFMMNKDSEYV